MYICIHEYYSRGSGLQKGKRAEGKRAGKRGREGEKKGRWVAGRPRGRRRRIGGEREKRRERERGCVLVREIING